MTDQTPTLTDGVRGNIAGWEWDASGTCVTLYIAVPAAHLGKFDDKKPVILSQTTAPMPDQAPVTNDDRRKARLWAEKVNPPHTNPGYSGTPSDIYNAARVILATVTAPETIAEELLNPDSYDEDTDGPYVVFDQARMMRIVKRVEALEEMVK